MSKKIILSYSTLADLKKWKHSWINKMLGLPKKEFEFLKEGKEIHKVLLGHMAGVQPDERIMKREANGGDFQLPKLEVYEKVDFDPDTKKYFDVDDKYSMVTFVDGLNLTESFILEVKTSSKAWTPGMYRDLMQRKIYSIAFPGMKRSFLVSSGRDQTLPGWEHSIKVFSMQNSEKDREEAMRWIKEGIAVLEKGDFDPDEKELAFISSKFNKCWYVGCRWCEA